MASGVTGFDDKCVVVKDLQVVRSDHRVNKKSCRHSRTQQTFANVRKYDIPRAFCITRNNYESVGTVASPVDQLNNRLICSLLFFSWCVFTFTIMAHLSQERVEQLYQEFGELKVLDDVIRHRAADSPAVPILGYPRFKHSVDDYELFTGKQLDLFIDNAVQYFIKCGFEPVCSLLPCSLLIRLACKSIIDIYGWLIEMSIEWREDSRALSPVKFGLHHLLLRSQQIGLHNTFALPPHHPSRNTQPSPKDKLHHNRPWPITTYPSLSTRDQPKTAS